MGVKSLHLTSPSQNWWRQHEITLEKTLWKARSPIQHSETMACQVPSIKTDTWGMRWPPLHSLPPVRLGARLSSGQWSEGRVAGPWNTAPTYTHIIILFSPFPSASREPRGGLQGLRKAKPHTEGAWILGQTLGELFHIDVNHKCHSGEKYTLLLC